MLPGAFDHFLGEHRHPLGADEARGDGVDIDVRRPELDRGGAGEALERGLARRVVGHAEPRASRLVGAHADDLAIPLLPEDLGDGADAVEGTSHVGVHHLAPRLIRHPPQRPIHGDTGIVDQEVHRAESLDGVGEEPFDGTTIPDITARGIDHPAHGGAGRLGEQRLRGHVAARQVDVAERHLAALPREFHRDAAAEPGRAAGHDGDLARESARHRLWQWLLERGAGVFLLRVPCPTAKSFEKGWHGWARYGRAGGSAREDTRPVDRMRTADGRGPGNVD